jgi:hypothetical protein
MSRQGLFNSRICVYSILGFAYIFLGIVYLELGKYLFYRSRTLVDIGLGIWTACLGLFYTVVKLAFPVLSFQRIFCKIFMHLNEDLSYILHDYFLNGLTTVKKIASKATRNWFLAIELVREQNQKTRTSCGTNMPGTHINLIYCGYK